jgi:hypothetical protein
MIVAEDNGEIVSFVDLLWLEPPQKGVGFAVLMMALVDVLGPTDGAYFILCGIIGPCRSKLVCHVYPA